MRNLRTYVQATAVMMLVSFSALAHQIALKDGRIIAFDHYRASEQSLFYTDSSGKEIKVPLSDIDYDHTRALNATDPQPLDIPGLAFQTPPASSKGEPSLADIARQAQKSTPASAATRVFTDDNFGHTTSVNQSQQQRMSAKDSLRADTEAANKAISDLESKTARQLSNEVVGDIQFVGRPDWEDRLHNQSMRLVETARMIVAVANNPSGNEGTMNSASWNFSLETSKFNNLKAEGIAKAADWERTTRR
jgi:hypothetical protein